MGLLLGEGVVLLEVGFNEKHYDLANISVELMGSSCEY